MLYHLQSLRGLALLAIAFAFAAAPAAAQVFSFSGATEPTDPTFQRPFTAGDGTSGSCSLSSIGSDVAFDTYTFTPTEDGTYNVTVTFGADEDGYAFIYGGSFDPNDACANLIDLDSGLSGVSELEELSLMGGTDYIIVVSSYRTGEFVTYSGVVTQEVDPVIVFNFGGDTTGDPTFNRPFTVGDGTAGSCLLSGAGTAVPYETTTFTPDRDSEYDIVINDTPDYDEYVFLYEGTFDPTMPCVDLIALDDDDGSVGAGSRIEDVMLMGGTTYTIVVSGFSNDDFGPYTGFVQDNMPPVVGDDIDLMATATSSLTVAPGGSVSFDYTISNNSGSDATGDLYFTADNDGGNQVASGLIRSGTLPDGQTIMGMYRQRIPAGAPAGTYDYCLRVGNFGSMNAVDSECFTLVITGTRPALAAATPALDEKAREGQISEAYEAQFAGLNWTVTDASAWQVVGGITSDVPAEAIGVYPNPFAARTQIAFALDTAADVSLAVYDVLGRQVAVLVDAEMDAGSHSVAFDAAGLSAGTYLYRLQVGGEVQTGQLSLVK